MIYKLKFKNRRNSCGNYIKAEAIEKSCILYLSYSQSPMFFEDLKVLLKKHFKIVKHNQNRCRKHVHIKLKGGIAKDEKRI